MWNNAEVQDNREVAIVAETSDRMAVMYAGGVVESGPLPSVGGDRMRRRVVPQGDPPTPIDPPPGCPFAGRCPKAEARCHREKPTLAVQDDMPDHSVACHYPEPS